MSFRRNGKSAHENERDWNNWLASVAEFTLAVGLPQSVLESEEAWWYFVDRTYSQAGYHGREAWFDRDSMSPAQREAFWQLLERWLKDRWPDAPDHALQGLHRTYDPIHDDC